MAEVKTEQDPSIEEILESIRQIISDDSGAEAKPAAEKPVASAPPQPAPPQPMEKVLDLTEKVAPPQPVAAAPAPAPAPAAPVSQPQPAADSAALLSNATTEAATAAMAKLLTDNVAVERDVPGRLGSVTLEDMARDLMRPLVKSWLDQNLPQIIEKMVQKEIEKISRRAMDR